MLDEILSVKALKYFLQLPFTILFGFFVYSLVKLVFFKDSNY